MSAKSDLNVLIIDLAKGFGGASSRVLSILENSSLEHVALAGLKNSPVTQAANEMGVPVHVVGSHKADPRILWRLINIIQMGNFQVIDTHNIQAKFWGSLAANFTRRASVSTIHSWYTHEHGGGSTRGKIYTNLELLTNRNLCGYITVSANDRQALIQAKIQPSEINLIYNAVDIEPSNISGIAEQLQSQFGIPKGAVICTSVGRMAPVKGYDILISAIEKIAVQCPDLHCLIVGDGDLYANLELQIQQSGLHNRVHLLGYQSHNTVLSILKSSHIFVMPSRYEGTPIALLEAAALGRAIVASDAGGIPELVENGKHAILIPPEDVQSLGQALMLLTSDLEMAEQFGIRAQKRVQDEFNLEGLVQATEQVYIKAWAKHQDRIK